MKDKKEIIDVEPEDEKKPDEPGTEAEGESSGEDSQSKDEKNADGTDANSGKQLKEILDGTARIGKSIGQAFVGMAEIFKGRDYVVMVRVNKDSLDKIDELIESGMFKSRSESAAYLIARGIQSDNELFHKIEDKVSEINRLKEELRSMLDFD